MEIARLQVFASCLFLCTVVSLDAASISVAQRRLSRGNTRSDTGEVKRGQLDDILSQIEDSSRAFQLESDFADPDAQLVRKLERSVERQLASAGRTLNAVQDQSVNHHGRSEDGEPAEAPKPISTVALALEAAMPALRAPTLMNKTAAKELMGAAQRWAAAEEASEPLPEKDRGPADFAVLQKVTENVTNLLNNITRKGSISAYRNEVVRLLKVRIWKLTDKLQNQTLEQQWKSGEVDEKSRRQALAEAAQLEISANQLEHETDHNVNYSQAADNMLDPRTDPRTWLFRRFDTDQDTFISKAELAHGSPVLTEDQVNRMIIEMDHDGDNQIAYSEFSDGMYSVILGS